MMRRAIVLLLLLPATASAVPAGAPETSPSLVGAPYIVRSADGMVRLVFRTDAPLEQRYDGLIGGGASVAGHAASIGTVGDCYTAALRFPSRRGRRYHVSIATEQGDPAPIDRCLKLRRAQPGDRGGRPLGC
jgi:hypothetical protein